MSTYGITEGGFVRKPLHIKGKPMKTYTLTRLEQTPKQTKGILTGN